MPTPDVSHGAPVIEDAGGRWKSEPWGRRLWLALLLVILAAGCLESYGISKWPMADDEVPSLVELGILHNGTGRYFSSPGSQISRLPRATPVWNWFQRTAIAALPAGELSYRIPSLVCGLLASAFIFLIGARWRGLWFAAALSVMVNGSHTFIYLQQLNRFYSLPFLLLALTLAAMWWPRGGAVMILATSILAALTVLSHNITLLVFGLEFVAAVVCWWLGTAPLPVTVRSGTALLVSVLIYVFYLRPIVSGWQSTGNPTPVLISFAAHATIPLLALSLLGAWFVIRDWRSAGPMLWWLLVAAGSLCAFELTTGMMSWNPRYFLFFLPPLWMLSAHAMTTVASRLESPASRVVWFACVALLLAPSLVSHLLDGSRHDYRKAAEVLVAQARPGDPILSDDAETISYYLPEPLRRGLDVRTRVTTLPASECFVVTRSNAWLPQPRFPGRQAELVAEIATRRLDEFSHILRIYRVGPVP
jgi:hypothetical protein